MEYETNPSQGARIILDGFESMEEPCLRAEAANLHGLDMTAIRAPTEVVERKLAALKIGGVD